VDAAYYICLCSEIPKTSVGKFDKIAIKKKLNELSARLRKLGNGQGSMRGATPPHIINLPLPFVLRGRGRRG